MKIILGIFNLILFLQIKLTKVDTLIICKHLCISFFGSNDFLHFSPHIQLNVTADAHTGYHQPDFRKPLRPGIWTVHLMYNWKAVCHTKFLIVPRSGSTIPRPENLGPSGDIYVDHNFTSVARLFPALQPAAKLMKAAENGRKIGVDLLAWLDELVADFYDVKAACVEGLLATTMCRDTAWSSYFPDDSQRFPDIPAADWHSKNVFFLWYQYFEFFCFFPQLFIPTVFLSDLTRRFIPLSSFSSSVSPLIDTLILFRLPRSNLYRSSPPYLFAKSVFAVFYILFVAND